MHNNARLIRLPSHVIGGLGVIRSAKLKLELELGREPTVDELAAESKISREKLLLYSTPSFPARHLNLSSFLTRCSFSLALCVAADSSASVLSLEICLGTSQSNLHSLKLTDKITETQPSPEDMSDHIRLKDEVAGLMGHTLNEREIKVLKLRYGFMGGIPQSLDQVGEAVSVSRDTVRRIEAKALNKLRRPNKRSPEIRTFLST